MSLEPNGPLPDASEGLVEVPVDMLESDSDSFDDDLLRSVDAFSSSDEEYDYT